MAKNFDLPPELTVEDVVEVQKSMAGFLKMTDPLVDCDGSKLKVMDSAGLQLLLAFSKASLKKGKVCRLVNPDPELREIMSYTGADKVIAVEGALR